MFRIIDNKKVELTNDEWDLYQKICQSYDRPNFKGEDLFKDLFVTNEKGIIIFLKPPSGSSYFSFEIFFFVISIMVHQHLSLAASEIAEMHKEQRLLNKESKELIAEMKQLRDELRNKITVG